VASVTRTHTHTHRPVPDPANPPVEWSEFSLTTGGEKALAEELKSERESERKRAALRAQPS